MNHKLLTYQAELYMTILRSIKLIKQLCKEKNMKGIPKRKPIINPDFQTKTSRSFVYNTSFQNNNNISRFQEQNNLMA